MGREAPAPRMMEQTVVNRRYRVDRPIGDGGMAVVYRGHDLLLGRDVAIKALRPQFAADPGFRARFEREAQAAAGFTHPNIIDIYDVGEEEGTPYIVMAFVRGQTLAEIIDREGPFHPDDVAALLTQIGGALDYAHERGYVHRDVKPQNVLVDARGVARVVDFGIAKGLADADLTDVGTSLGTVHYLSPEQASGLMATPASDVYSAGVVAFEMLTKRLPFEADSPVAIALRHVHDRPAPPSAFDPDVPPAVDAIVLRTLDKDPTRRFASAGALAEAMTDWRRYPPGAGDRAVRAAPRQSVAVPAPLPVPVPAASPSQRTIVSPSVGGAAAANPPPMARPVRPGGGSSAATRDDVGCVTWVVGTAILVGLVGLIWLGFQLTPRLAELGGGDDVPEVRQPAAPMAPTITGGLAPPTENDPAAGTDGASSTIAPMVPAASEQTAAPTLVIVPDLTNLSIQDATDAVNDLGLQLAEGEAIPSEGVPAGAVTDQEPPPGAELPQGETVSVLPSGGSSRVDLEALALVGRTADEAAALLAERNLVAAVEEVPSPDVEPGRVVGTDPARRAGAAETVTLQVSAGDVVRIPGAIQGQPVEQVAGQLEALGLQVLEQIPVGRATIEASGLDLEDNAIADGDVVGVQGENVTFEALVPAGTEVELVYYDLRQDRS